MKEHTYIDTEARHDFEGRIKGIATDILDRVLDGSDELGWWRSYRIRAAWRKLTSLFRPESHTAMRQQYCG